MIVPRLNRFGPSDSNGSMLPQLVVTHRIVVHRSTVRRTYLQQLQSWLAKQNNVCRTIKIMCMIIQKRSIGLLCILYVRLPVNLGEGAFFIDTYKSFLCA